MNKEKLLGSIIPPIDQLGFSVLVSEVLDEPILGAFVGVNYKRGDQEGILIGKVLDFEVVNDLSEYLSLAKGIQSFASNEQVQRIVERKSALILKCQVVSALDSVEGNRIPYDAPIRPFAPAFRIDEKELNKLLGGNRFFHIGHHYGGQLLHHLYLQDFKNLDEAYHFVLAGLSGSGKSTLAKLLLVGYARHPEMRFLIFDTAGEFSRAFSDQRTGKFTLKLRSLWKWLGRKDPLILDLDNLVFDRWEHLREILKREKVFAQPFISRADYESRAVDYLIQELEGGDVKLAKLSSAEKKVKDVLTKEDFVRSVYTGADHQKRLRGEVERSWNTLWNRLKKVFEKFERQSGRYTFRNLAKTVLEQRGTTVVLNLSKMGWEDPLKYLLIRTAVEWLHREAMKKYWETGKAELDTLVVIEEAHRLVPPSTWVKDNEDLARTRRIVLQGLTETRKAGLGWMLISTRLGNLDRRVFDEARIKIIGWGLSTGEDADRIRDSFGREALTYYSGLPDPSDPLSNRRQHVFMISGPITVLSKRTPEFVEIFDGPEKFLRENGLEHAESDKSDPTPGSAQGVEELPNEDDLPV